ncbi:short-chain dehydrogenase [Brasilonema octagenarum UFV-E1]|uniref:Short-chain dehydrogenase n=2 Tax=Brasilonema TaxID=383614 RepID=A0A856MIC2_9CYAN|nr:MULTISPECIES: SDR family oxidoreductase [Brasilonema]NMF63907.1 short-chain dehydrogenase [Brasilonema octagenarum UFV-OR1]QDL09974.1 short-chain dehydrogenase [Brasilonema sennae CENA114]QDL16326.1 short-chain dehydrogenase [Brasilonema octagenarum UFV-E1]
MQSNDKKIALVTGANKGLGFEISRQLAKQGITVLIGARDETKGKEAAEKLQAEGFDVQSIKLDVTDTSTIETVAKTVEEKFAKLDILVNNAGILGGREQLPSSVSVASVKEIFETNFFGVISVTQAFLPLLHKSPAGRIVNVSSGLGSLTQHSDPNHALYDTKLLGYNSSKTALNAFTVTLAYELKDTPIKVNSADPDSCKTDMGTDEATYTAEQGADTPVWLATLPEDGPTGGFFNSRKPIPW